MASATNKDNTFYPVNNPPAVTIANPQTYGFTDFNNPYEQRNNKYPPDDPYLQSGPPPQYGMAVMQQGAAGNQPTQTNIENGNEWGNMSGLTEKVTRIRFIRKVYLILTTQLIFTFGIVALFVFVKPVKDFARTTAGYTVYIISYFLFFGLIVSFSIIMCCKPQIMRKTPFNYIFLGLIVSFKNHLTKFSAKFKLIYFQRL